MLQIHYFIFSLILITKGHSTKEIITIQTNDNITCITEDTETPIFILPPVSVQPKPDKLNFLKDGVWFNDDWSLKNTNSSLQGPVIDKRWENFETYFTNYANFTATPSLSFSIYSLQEIQFLMTDKDDSIFQHNVTDEKPSNKWTHFTILLSNQNVYIYENGELKFTKVNFEPTHLVMKTENSTYWKIHNYEFKWANTVRQQNYSTILSIPPTGKPCVMLYVSLCQDCLLEVSVKSGGKNKTEEIRAVNQSDSLMASWQSHKIDIEPHMESNISFVRGMVSGSDGSGDWAIDIRECPVLEKNKVIYNITTTKESRQRRTCAFLTNKDEPDDIGKEAFQCDPGLLGLKCDISCEDILGSGSSKCEKCRICENFDCVCAWGYQGDFCQDSCAAGTWGLSCEEYCDLACDTCDATTGYCGLQYAWIWCAAIAGIFFVVLVISIIVGKVKRNR